MEFIDLKTQYQRIKSAIDGRIAAVLERGAYIMGPEIEELELALARHCGASSAIVTGSGTDALLMAMMAIGIQPGDEVITSPFSFGATTETIALLGARPVFVDIDPRTFNIDPRLIERAVTPRTKLILPVSLFGQCAEFETINAVAEYHGLPVLEDAAQSFGATRRERYSCTFSRLAATSFYPAKPLGCYGDAGACFTDDDDYARRLRQIRDHGQDGRYNHVRLGINGRCDTIQAAILLAKLEIYADECAKRLALAKQYDDLILATCPNVRPPLIQSGNTSVYAQYTVLVSQRERVKGKLLDKGVPTAVHYPTPLHLQPVFASTNWPRGSLPIAERVATEVLSLPMHPYLTDAELSQVVTALAEATEG
jgi:UDP-2-acetamido-2-deoxy-ribo-hexuluronate aminotransferase